jgi:hypothetical protein
MGWVPNNICPNEEFIPPNATRPSLGENKPNRRSNMQIFSIIISPSNDYGFIKFENFIDYNLFRERSVVMFWGCVIKEG